MARTFAVTLGMYLVGGLGTLLLSRLVGSFAEPLLLSAVGAGLVLTSSALTPKVAGVARAAQPAKVRQLT